MSLRIQRITLTKIVLDLGKFSDKRGLSPSYVGRSDRDPSKPGIRDDRESVAWDRFQIVCAQPLEDEKAQIIRGDAFFFHKPIIADRAAFANWEVS